MSSAAILSALLFTRGLQLSVLSMSYNFLMADFQKQNICVQFCSEMLKTSCDCNATGGAHITELFPLFKHQKPAAEDCRHPGCPSTFNTDERVEKVDKILNKNKKSTISIACRLHLSYGTYQ